MAPACPPSMTRADCRKRRAAVSRSKCAARRARYREPPRPARCHGPRHPRRPDRAGRRHPRIPARDGGIRRTEAALDGCGALVLPLHGDLPPAEQDRALRPAETRRVVLATSIAETSLTVPGVRIVIDGGWRRARGWIRRPASPGWRRCTLTARQPTSGPAAPDARRLVWPSACGRKALHRGLPPFDRPEILEAELSGLALDCAAWGTPPGKLRFPDFPPPGALAAAAALLTSWARWTRPGAITPLGSTHGTARRASAAGRDDAGRGHAKRERRGPPILPRCWRSAIRCVAQTRRPICRCAWPRWPTAIRTPIAPRFPASGAPPRSIGTGSASHPISSRTAIPGGWSRRTFPDRIAQRRGEPGSFRLAGGGRPAGAHRQLAGVPLLAVAALEMKGSSRRSASPRRLFQTRCRAVLAAARDGRGRDRVRCGHRRGPGRAARRAARRAGADDRTVPADPAGWPRRSLPQWRPTSFGHCPGPRRHGSFRLGSP